MKTMILESFINEEDGIVSYVTKHAQGYAVTLKDVDSGEVAGIRIYKTRDAAIEYAKKVVGKNPCKNPLGAKKTISEIANRKLGVTTLAERGRDRLDFYDLAVWKIKDALEAAYQAGSKDAKKGRIKVKNPLGAELLIINPQGRPQTKADVKKIIERHIKIALSHEAKMEKFPHESKEYWKEFDAATAHHLKAESYMPGGSFWKSNPRRSRMKLRIRSRNKRRRSKVRKIRFGGKLLSLSQLKTKYGKRKGKAIWRRHTKRKSRVMVGMRKASRKALGYGKKSWKALVKRFGVMKARRHYRKGRR